jgi:hypothetical protein
MNLQSKYLPHFDVSKVEHIEVDAPVEIVFALVEKLDFSMSRIIRWLFRLRGLPVPGSLSLQGLENLRFIRLETIRNEAIIIGLIGQFWTPAGNLQRFLPEEFIEYDDHRYAKATWSFHLEAQGKDKAILHTETRVFCPTSETKKKFRMYWRLIEPFSTWIRKEILKGVKAKAEAWRFSILDSQ